MGFLYKLVDFEGLMDAKNGIIVLSHPIFEFKGSEGMFINFAKRIYDKYKLKGLNIKPSNKDLEEIRDWCITFKKTYGSDFEECYIGSESTIIFCGIMHGFCGYFTKSDLENEQIKNDFVSKCKLKDKVAIIRIDEKVFEHRHWRSQKVEGLYERFFGNPYDLSGFNGFMHPIDIVYNSNYDKYDELLRIYNSDALRHGANWFNNLSSEYEWQNEKRLIFFLNSLEPNSSRIGCKSVYEPTKECISWEEKVYGYVVDAIDWCCKGPRFIKLKLDNNEVEIFEEFNKSKK